MGGLRESSKYTFTVTPQTGAGFGPSSDPRTFWTLIQSGFSVPPLSELITHSPSPPLPSPPLSPVAVLPITGTEVTTSETAVNVKLPGTRTDNNLSFM